MKKKLLICLIICFILFPIFCEQLSNYNFQKIKTIPIGDKEGELGWEGWALYAGGQPGPSTFVISENRLLYIPDRINKRINVYDLELNFKKTIIEKKEGKGHLSLNIKIDNSNLIYINKYEGLIKINNNGEQLLKIVPKKLPKNVFRKYYYPCNNKILILNDKNELNIISDSGLIEGQEKALRFIKNENQKHKLTYNLPIDKINILKNANENPKFVIIKGKLIFANYTLIQEYYNQLKPLRVFQTENKSIHEINLNTNDYNFLFIGYDSENNSYWKATEQNKKNNIKKQIIVIYSCFGQLMDAFCYSQIKNNEYDFSKFKTSGSFISIAPNGDVYFMRGSDTGHHFWKIPNNW